MPALPWPLAFTSYAFWQLSWSFDPSEEGKSSTASWFTCQSKSWAGPWGPEVIDLDFERVICLGGRDTFLWLTPWPAQDFRSLAGKSQPCMRVLSASVWFKILINDQTLSWSLDPLILIPVSMIWTWFVKLQGIKLPVKLSSWRIKLRGSNMYEVFNWKASADSLDITVPSRHYLWSVISLSEASLRCSIIDTPSPTGTVNRVVQGVIIHPFHKNSH